jgi:diguanylate cyclase (GGDEF)-like protein/hemerythrin-like metal-binding protein
MASQHGEHFALPAEWFTLEALEGRVQSNMPKQEYATGRVTRLPPEFKRCSSRWLIDVLLFLLAAVALGQAQAAPVLLTRADSDRPLGTAIRYFKEGPEKLTPDQARAVFERGDAKRSDAPILTTGIGSAPVWMHLTVVNPQPAAALRRLTIENAWLDEVDIHFVEAGRVTDSVQLGDAQPFGKRPLRERFFSVDHTFKPGATDIYLRVATADPLVVPIYLRDLDQAAARESAGSYSYGFLYGYLAALLAYNALIFVSIKDRRYLLYAGFLGAFIAMNLAYTGHGFRWLWPEHVTVQRWIIPTLMMLYGSVGVLFAKNFLDSRRHLPRADRHLNRLIAAFAAAYLLACVVGDTQAEALKVAFVFALVFALSMLFLGIWAVRFRIPNARYFLLASLASALGATLTALSVWGLIGFDEWRYRAVEIGMVVDATLLAIALGGQFRAAQLQRVRAEIAGMELAEVNQKLNESLQELEQLAATDRLTGLWNRRHFEQAAAGEMDRALRYRLATSLLLFDIDHFKVVNDTCGHHTGDDILKELARVVRQHMRESDSVTRWGGEEFTVLMPNTNLSAAAEAAEKLRQAIQAHSFSRGLKLTISVGVAEWAGQGESLDTWVDRADTALYQAKHGGRNCVVLADLSFPATGDPVMQLHWNPRYESGHAEIDGQHRQLFHDANRLLTLLPAMVGGRASQDDNTAMLGVVDALLADVKLHFATEERILSECNWPGLAEHRVDHGQLLARAQDLRCKLVADPPACNATTLVDFIVVGLIANHILRSDRSYFAALRAEAQGEHAEKNGAAPGSSRAASSSMTDDGTRTVI